MIHTYKRSTLKFGKTVYDLERSVVDRYIIQLYMKLTSILFESLDLKRIKRKSLFVKRTLCVYLIFTGVIHDTPLSLCNRMHV